MHDDGWDVVVLDRREKVTGEGVTAALLHEVLEYVRRPCPAARCVIVPSGTVSASRVEHRREYADFIQEGRSCEDSGQCWQCCSA